MKLRYPCSWRSFRSLARISKFLLNEGWPDELMSNERAVSNEDRFPNSMRAKLADRSRKDEAGSNNSSGSDTTLVLPLSFMILANDASAFSYDFARRSPVS